MPNHSDRVRGRSPPRATARPLRQAPMRAARARASPPALTSVSRSSSSCSIVGGAELRLQFLHAAEQTSLRAGFADLGFHHGQAEQRPELTLDQPDLGRRLEPTFVEVARAVEVAEAVRCPAQIVVRPCAPVEVAARLADRQALLEELDRPLVLALAHQLVAEVVQRDREQPLVTPATADRHRLLEQRECLVAITPSARGDRKQVDRHRVDMLLVRCRLRDLEDA